MLLFISHDSHGDAMPQVPVPLTSFAWFWTKIGGSSAFCPKKACLSIQLKAKNVKKRITC